MWNLLLLFGLKSVREMRLKFRRCLIDGSAQVLVVISYPTIAFDFVHFSKKCVK